MCIAHYISQMGVFGWGMGVVGNTTGNWTIFILIHRVGAEEGIEEKTGHWYRWKKKKSSVTYYISPLTCPLSGDDESAIPPVNSTGWILLILLGFFQWGAQAEIVLRTGPLLQTCFAFFVPSRRGRICTKTPADSWPVTSSFQPQKGSRFR